MYRNTIHTAGFFRKVAKATDAARSVERDRTWFVEFNRLVEVHRPLIQAVYAEIESSAKHGGIRFFFDQKEETKELKNNLFVQHYLTSHGFSITDKTVEWWEDKAKEPELK
jgi:hypothetical protein